MKVQESKQSEATTRALNDLIVVNNDRSEGYTKAAEQTKDSDLKQLFTRLADDSKKFSEELRNHVTFKEAADRDETSFSGKIYRAWMDIRKDLSANDRQAILSSCEYGEDVALKTYNNVLKNENELNAEVLDLVRRQRAVVQKGHDEVKRLRDNEKQRSDT
jgi:uncharacterized protein (TIGR02284 family)